MIEADTFPPFSYLLNKPTYVYEDESKNIKFKNQFLSQRLRQHGMSTAECNSDVYTDISTRSKAHNLGEFITFGR